MSESNSSSRAEQSDSRVVARKTVYRQVSATLGLASGVLALFATNVAYFLFLPFLYIGGFLMIVGGILVWYQKPIPGGILVLMGMTAGGFYGLPSFLFLIPGAAALPLLPVGFILPGASFILAFKSIEGPAPGKPPETGYYPSQIMTGQSLLEHMLKENSPRGFSLNPNS